ncbi:hypothetical protein EMIHUDRAFT_207994 [Emiliania huxleyi CCMP1516]|uniref:C2 domain-containing protein n=2 Tax=Emiliania huxleyi TaxID=2903 RepID=A0A0D3JBR5_EMIH1|nr:hypothetical protein EMIHUDRAFT_207994 [Emiliania huxleyi CCMP1516]EOD20950.1 hypothetical protein EMIHUDRAFT_207994 [Emiliania huxleyi CCMP1516]|eukprot:XP_005773379.1 hypothetical protein EMIHUDRAFT_207994 [Emiliania huxleyi CCMP1516]
MLCFLTSIDLSSNNLQEEEVLVLTKALRTNTVLKSIDLRYNSFGAQGWSAIFRALRDNQNNQIESWDLSDQKIDAETAGVLAEYVSVSAPMATLYLSNNLIGPRGGAAIAEALRGRSGLTTLNLSWNNIGPEGGVAIGKALAVNLTLTELDLSGNFICGLDEDGEGKYNESGIVALAEALGANAVLKSVDLCNNKISQQGAAAIANALRSNAALTELNIWYNDIGPEGAKTLGSAFELNAELAELYLEETKIRDEGAKALARLDFVDLCGNLGTSFGARGLVPRAKARAINRFDQAHDEIFDRQISHFISTIGGVARESANAAYMPQRVARFVDGVFTRGWEVVGEGLKSDVMASYRSIDREHQLRIKQWAKGPPLQLNNLLTWVRAKVLYAAKPADATIWKVMQDPFGASILAIKLLPFFGVNVLIYTYFFLNIDRKDEYQLVEFVLSFKGFQVINALSLAIKGALKFYYCLNSPATDTYSSTANTLEYVSTANTLDVEKCLLIASDSSEAMYSAFIYSLEVLRVGLLFAATYLLVSGKAYGGLGEIRALEQVRLDAADARTSAPRAPSLEDQKRIEKEKTRRAKDDIRRTSIEEARRTYGAEVRTGGYLPAFMRYDAYCLVILLTVGFGRLLFTGQLSTSHWMFWQTLYYMKMAYGLLSFPFLVFRLPLVGKGLVQAMPTGYDESGALVQMLSPALMKRKKAFDDRASARAHEHSIRKLQAARKRERRLDALAAARQRLLPAGGTSAAWAAGTVRRRRGGARPGGREGWPYSRLEEEDGEEDGNGTSASPTPTAGDLEAGRPLLSQLEFETRAAIAMQAQWRGYRVRAQPAWSGMPLPRMKTALALADTALMWTAEQGRLKPDYDVEDSVVEALWHPAWPLVAVSLALCLDFWIAKSTTDAFVYFLGEGLISLAILFLLTLPCVASLPFHPRARALTLATAREREERGHVTVTLLSAKRLKAAERAGTSDSYAVLNLGASKRRSSVVRNSLDPVWNESFSWNGVFSDLLQDGLVVTLFDCEKASRDDCLGMARVQLDKLLHAREATFVTPLSLQGSVRVHVQWRSAAAAWIEARGAAFAAARLPPAPAPAGPPQVQVQPASQGVLLVRLFSAMKLRSANGLPDPYAEVRLGNHCVVRSSVQWRTRDPIWDESFEFSGEMAQLLAEPLCISLYDTDGRFDAVDDSLGEATLDLSPLHSRCVAALSGTVLYMRTQPRGQVNVLVSWTSAPGDGPRD